MQVLIYVSASVCQNKLLKTATHAEVEMVVKLWLRYAKDRSGGRAARINSRPCSGVNDTDDSDDSE